MLILRSDKVSQSTFTTNEFESENAISQLIKDCDQSGDKVSKNDKRYYICSILTYTVPSWIPD